MSITILVIGRHAQILETVLRLLNSKSDWQAVGALTDDEAIAVFDQHVVDVVLMGGGVEEASEQQLGEYFRSRRPTVKVIQHFGGGSGLLFAEIYEALKIS